MAQRTVGVLLFAAIWAVLSVALFALLIYRYRIRLGDSPWRFQFRLTDLWAQVVSMVPTQLVAATAFSEAGASQRDLLLVLALGMALGQLAGGYIGMLNREASRAKGNMTRLSALNYIAGGSLWGLFTLILPGILALLLSAERLFF
ncbi:MAG: hypothetical protein M5U26_30725 [Planctomycetota bacterium]|nr:hypothetical protein [Planctomycetota bacterium]